MGIDRPNFGARTLSALSASLLAAFSLNAVAQDVDEGSIEELVVTGSLIVTGENSVSPVVVIDGEDLANQPRLTLGDFFQVELPQNFAEDVETENSGMQGRLRGDRGVGLNLRGLGEENTLTLINGVRTIQYSVPNQTTGWRSIDINSQLPSIAVNNVQVLLDGGSAIYGTDALAGVVNLIPDYEFRGLRVDAGVSYEEDNYANGSTDWAIMWGGEIGDTSIIAAYERSLRNPVAAIDDANDIVSANPQPGDPAWDTAEIANPLNWNNILDATAVDGLGIVSNAGALSGAGIELAQGMGWSPTAGDGLCAFSGMRAAIADESIDGNYNTPGTDCYTVLRDASIVPYLVPGLDLTQGFIDPLCGMSDVTGIVPRAAGVLGSVVTGDASNTDCYDFNRGAREMSNRDTINESAIIAIQHEFSDSIRYAAELTWAENYIVDPFYWSTTVSGRGAPPLLELAAREPVDGRFVDYTDAVNAAGTPDFTTGDFVVEWDHPGMAFYADYLSDQGIADADNPFLQNGSADAGIIPNGVYSISSANEFYNNRSGTHTSRFGNSLTFDLNDSWSALIGGAYATHSTTNYIDSVIPQRLSLALDGLGGPNCDAVTGTPGVGGCEYFNPFLSAAIPGIGDVDPNLANSRDLMFWLRGPAQIDYGAEFYAFSYSIQGHFEDLELPGGPVGMALGVEYRHDELSVDYDDNYNAGIYDLNDGVPFVDWGGVTETGGIILDFSLPVSDTVNVQVAGRMEKINTEGVVHNSFTPKIGFNWEASDRLTIRGAYNESFRAPAIAHIIGESGVNGGNISILGDEGQLDAARDYLDNDAYDPHLAMGNQTDFAVGRINKGGPGVEPQTATAWSLGATYDITDDLRMTLSYLNLDFQDTIEVIGGADLMNTICGTPVNLTDTSEQTRLAMVAAAGAGPLPSDFFSDVNDPTSFTGVDYFVRDLKEFDDNGTRCYQLDALGNPTVEYRRYANVGYQKQEVLDFSFNYSVATDYGTFGFSPSGSWTLSDVKNELVSQAAFAVDPVNCPSPEVNLAGVRDINCGLGRGNQEFRVNVPFSWRYDNHSISLTGRWISGYFRNDTGEPDTEEYISGDFRYGYRMNDNVNLGLNVSNVLNTQQVRSTTPAGIRSIGANVSITF